MSFSLATITRVCLSSPCIAVQQLGAILTPITWQECLFSSTSHNESHVTTYTWNVWKSPNSWVFYVVYNKKSEVCGQYYQTSTSGRRKSPSINNFHFSSFLTHLEGILVVSKYVISRHTAIILNLKEESYSVYC